MSKTHKEKLLSIPTNIITGFLGVGKTTVITHLLKQKPVNERWAVLVNEFGEIGIDGSLFDGQKNYSGDKSNEQGVYISEVPGGCMCCAAGLPMQVALNTLLKRARPDRLLIEPTGLGHPKEVLEVLSANAYKDVLTINTTISLVDARKISDKRYTENDTFNQQLDIADVIVANKSDLYSAKDLPALFNYLDERFNSKYKPAFPLKHGELNMNWLNGLTDSIPGPPARKKQGNNVKTLIRPQDTINYADANYVTIKNKGDGFFSQGWIFKSELIFDKEKLNNLLLGINADRVKGVFITNQGIVGFNMVDSVLTEITLDDSIDSRIEVISNDPTRFNGLEQQLLNCV